MRQLSSEMLQAIFAGETGEAILALVTIEEDSLPEPIRVTSDGVSTFSADQDSDTAADATGNGNDGTLVGGPTWTSDGPNDAIRGALSFDGVDDDVVVDDAPEIRATDSMIRETWVNIPSVEPAGQEDGILWKNREYGFRNHDTAGSVQAYVNDQETGYRGVTSPEGTITYGQWHHLASVLIGSEHRFYVDLQLVGTDSNVGTINTDTASLRFASQANSPIRRLEGKLAEARAWHIPGLTHEQSLQQIADNMNKRLNGDEPGLVGYWPLDDTTDEFLSCPFRFSFPDQSDEGDVQARLEIDNVDRRITKAVRNATGTPVVTTQLVLGSTPDTIEAEFPDFELTNASYDKLIVEGTLTVESLVSLPYPAHTFDPSKFVNLF